MFLAWWLNQQGLLLGWSSGIGIVLCLYCIIVCIVLLTMFLRFWSTMFVICFFVICLYVYLLFFPHWRYTYIYLLVMRLIRRPNQFIKMIVFIFFLFSVISIVFILVRYFACHCHCPCFMSPIMCIWALNLACSLPGG